MSLCWGKLCWCMCVLVQCRFTLVLARPFVFPNDDCSRTFFALTVEDGKDSVRAGRSSHAIARRSLFAGAYTEHLSRCALPFPSLPRLASPPIACSAVRVQVLKLIQAVDSVVTAFHQPEYYKVCT